MGEFGRRHWSKSKIWISHDLPIQLRDFSLWSLDLQFSWLLFSGCRLCHLAKSQCLRGCQPRHDGWVSWLINHFFILCCRFHESCTKFTPDDDPKCWAKLSRLNCRCIPREHDLQKIFPFLIFLTFFGSLHAAPENMNLKHPNPAYTEWLDSYQGEFNQLKYTDITYRGDRRANAGREKLAPYSNRPEPGELTGNYLFQLGSEQTQGLEQDIALTETAAGSLSSNGIRFRPTGYQLRLAKRLFEFKNLSSHLDFTMRKSRAFVDRSDGTILRAPSGERIDSINGMQDNYFYNLDWTLRKPLAQKSRYSAELLGGVRFSDIGVEVNTRGSIANLGGRNSMKRDYRFRNLGIGPFVGFRANTPITNRVSTGVSIKQILLPSKGEATLSRFNQQSGGAVTVNETSIEEQFTSFPITELSWDLNFHYDQYKKLYVGYAYSHWNLYEIQGFGSENFRNLTMHGPRAALRFLF